MNTLKKLLKNFRRLFLYLCFLSFTVLLLFEGIYRWYWIDFYQPELSGLNPSLKEPKPIPSDKTILCLGDSFTADPYGYVSMLRDSLPDQRFINSAVPGTGVIQANMMAGRRVRQFDPDIVFYQIYVGNDLLDIRHPTNWSTLSPLRNVYWWTADRFRSLGFLNFRLLNVRVRFFDDIDITVKPKQVDQFSAERYSARQKLYFQADPDLVQNSAFLKGKMEKASNTLVRKLKAIQRKLPDSTKLVVIVIPHCMQVNSFFTDNMLEIGANSPAVGFYQPKYPLMQKLRTSLSGNDLQLINPLPEFRKQDKPGNRLYYENDPHLNERGHEVLTKMLLEVLSN